MYRAYALSPQLDKGPIPYQSFDGCYERLEYGAIFACYDFLRHIVRPWIAVGSPGAALFSVPDSLLDLQAPGGSIHDHILDTVRSAEGMKIVSGAPPPQLHAIHYLPKLFPLFMRRHTV